MRAGSARILILGLNANHRRVTGPAKHVALAEMRNFSAKNLAYCSASLSHSHSSLTTALG
jgi:hypothetical protein